MVTLLEGASGLRHLRWSREILASLEAHREHEPGLSPGEREALREEAALLRGLVQRLSEAVKPYRDFLERSRVELRARQRVGSFLCAEARRRVEERLSAHAGELESSLVARIEVAVKRRQATPATLEEHLRDVVETGEAAALLRSLPASSPLRELAGALDDAAAHLSVQNEAFSQMEEERRRPLKAGVRKAIAELQAELERMSDRLRIRFGETFLSHVYPEIARSGMVVVDDDDDDDDASAPRNRA